MASQFNLKSIIVGTLGFGMGCFIAYKTLGKKVHFVKYKTYIGKTNNFESELNRIKIEYKNNWKELYDRKWINIDNNNNKNGEQLSFSMLQFNILADGLSGIYDKNDSKQFRKTPINCLYFKYRGFRILEEIINISPDIVTLEEVDCFKFLLHYLSPYGYSGHFQSKLDSPCLKIAKKNNIQLSSDGVAIFYKIKKFEIIKHHIYRYNDPVIGMLIHFKFCDNKIDKEILIGVTHLKSTKNIKGETKRLKQLQFLLPKWREIQLKLNNSTTNLFIGCDLNSPNKNTKGFPPMTYNSVVNGNMFIKQYKDNKENIDIPSDYIDGYGLSLSSAYYIGLGKEPSFTTYKIREKIDCHTIDYIFYQNNNNWNVNKLLSIPNHQQIDKNTYIPSWNYPSDHFSIAATFKLK